MREVNPEMLSIARESRGLSQSDLAHKVGISQGILSKIENGSKSVSEDLLKRLVTALEYPEKFFFQLGRRYPGISYHRKRKTIAQKIVNNVDANVNILRMHFDEFLKNVEIFDNNVPFFRQDEEDMTPSDIAQAVRHKWMLPRGPIDNLTRVIEEAGCIILHCDFGTRMIDGLSICMPKSPPMMFISKNIPGDRLRFTIAHELGHIVMHEYPTSRMEEEANEFASEFLMPAQDIIHELSPLSLDRLAILKRRWKVSMQSLLMRASTLRKITDRSKQYLWMQLGQAGYRTHEPVEIELEQPTLYREIIDLHLEELGYTIGELSDVININRDEFERIYFDRPYGLRLIK